MKFLEPIRDRKKIAQIKNILCGQQRYRDLLLFVIGINTALRISDLLQLQLSQFLDENGNIKSKFWIKVRMGCGALFQPIRTLISPAQSARLVNSPAADLRI